MGVTDLDFPEKRKIYQQIVIFVLLRTLISQKRNNAIASARSPLAIDAYLNKTKTKMHPMRALALCTQCID